MGYSIDIGEQYVDEDGSISVIEEKHPGAPADGVPTDYTNSRWPSYGAWGGFCRAVPGLDAFMEQVMSKHPGYVDLTEEHRQTFNQIYERATLKDRYHRSRMEWLHYWINWAVDNCKTPIFYNR